MDPKDKFNPVNPDLLDLNMAVGPRWGVHSTEASPETERNVPPSPVSDARLHLPPQHACFVCYSFLFSCNKISSGHREVPRPYTSFQNPRHHLPCRSCTSSTLSVCVIARDAGGAYLNPSPPPPLRSNPRLDGIIFLLTRAQQK